MARRRVALALFLAASIPLLSRAPYAIGHAAVSTNTPLTVSLNTVVERNIAWDYLTLSSNSFAGLDRHVVPTRRVSAYCYYSQWRLILANPVSHERRYGVLIYDACNEDKQVFPVPTDPRQGSCNNDDAIFESARYSVCPIIAPGHLPVGLSRGRACNAEAIASTALQAALTPSTYDASRPTLLTLTTSFGSDFLYRLREGTCTDVLDWQDIGWTLRWSDGAADTVAGSGQSGITASHTLPAASAGGTRAADVTAIAHLHISGEAMDFDADGNLVTVPRDAYVDIGNHQDANGLGAAPVYTPPQLALVGRAAAQLGDGSVGSPDPQPMRHLTTIRGRLLDIYPDVAVIRPGTESIDGVVIGDSRSVTSQWTYLGGRTDAPTPDATAPGAAGSPTTPVGVQWNHAERLDANSQPIDEQVPLRLQVNITYPDGHVDRTTLSGDLPVSIYYPALADSG